MSRQCRLVVLTLWATVGTVALLLTPAAPWTPLFGWGPLLLLSIAPLLMLTVMQPAWPLMCLAALLRHRRRVGLAPWQGLGRRRGRVVF